MAAYVNKSTTVRGNMGKVSPICKEMFKKGNWTNYTNIYRVTDSLGGNWSRSELDVGSKRLRYIETVVEHFWERRRKGYIATYDIVLVFEGKAPPHSRDGQIRGAKYFVGKTRLIIERSINTLSNSHVRNNRYLAIKRNRKNLVHIFWSCLPLGTERVSPRRTTNTTATLVVKY